MRKLSFLSLLILLLASCNLSLYDQAIANNRNPVAVEENIPQKATEFSTEAPANVMATEAYYSDRINVTWSAVEGAEYYTIERAECESITSDESALVWHEILDITNEARYVDRDASLSHGMYYAYRVTAHSEGGAYSGETSAVSYGCLLSAPQSLSASQGDSFEVVTLTWQQMPGVSRYYIYKSISADSVGLGNYVGVVSQTSPAGQEEKGYTNTYSYEVDNNEQGQELYFSIRSSGPLGTISDSSNYRIGYTRVVGAASTPEVVDITKGSSIEGITIAWAPDPASSEDDPITYTVRRTSAGSAETVIFPLYSGQTLSPDADGNYSITDYNVREGVVYTYSIIASNSIGRSPAAVVTGYLLSPPVGITFEPDTTEREYRVSSFTLPVGGDEAGNENWEYEVELILQNGSTSQIGTLSRSQLESFIAKTELSLEGAVDFESEARHIRIYTVNGSVKSKSCLDAVIGGIPSPVQAATASRNRSTTENANSAGVYPVTISWTPATDYPSYSYMIRRTDGGFATGTSQTSVSDSNVVLGVEYQYEIQAYDPFGRTSGSSTTNKGYGAITGTLFCRIFESNILKPWESLDEHPEYAVGQSKGAIYSYVRQQGLGSLGSATTDGKTIEVDGVRHSGKISYNATQEGLGGRVTFSYTRYFSEANYLFYVASDFSYYMIVSLSGAGSVSASSACETAGLYPASVSFSRLSVSNNAFTGYYSITQHHENGDVVYEVNSQ